MTCSCSGCERMTYCRPAFEAHKVLQTLFIINVLLCFTRIASTVTVARNFGDNSIKEGHRSREHRSDRTCNMPHHPSEEEAPEGIFEKVAKDPSSTTESTASDHENHHNEHAPEASAKASAQDFQSKGPQIPMSMDGTSNLSLLYRISKSSPSLYEGC